MPQLSIGTAQFGMKYGITNREGETSTDEIKKILVYFGGSDKEGWTRKILKVLTKKEFRSWKADIVTGIQDLNLDIYKNDKYNLEKRIKIAKHIKI